MPDRRSHRGPHPEDTHLFAPAVHETLREATADLSWLLSRGYVNPSALTLVGDRYRLTARQRTAVERAACSDAALKRRRDHEVCVPFVAGKPLLIDGYNVLCTIEAALAGGIILAARDGTYRDMASMHGSYRKVAETEPALEIIGQFLQGLRPSKCTWFLDRPVSNSGRLATLIRQVAARHNWPWQVELVNCPDPILMDSEHVVATADSVILDYCRAWLNLSRYVILTFVPTCRLVDLAVP